MEEEEEERRGKRPSMCTYLEGDALGEASESRRREGVSVAVDNTIDCPIAVAPSPLPLSCDYKSMPAPPAPEW